MTISYHTNWMFGSYQDDLSRFILKVEGYKPNAYFEGTSIAIGIGYDLIQHTKAEIQADLSVTLTAAQTKLLDEARKSPKPTATRLNEIATGLGLTITADAAANSFKKIAAHTYEDRLDGLLGMALPNSQERIALFSMVYNGRLQDYSDLSKAPRILTDIQNALSSNNRAEAWYAIRYESGFARKSQNGSRPTE